MLKTIFTGLILIISYSCNNDKIIFREGRKIIYYEDGKELSQIIDFNKYAELDGYYISFDTLGNLQRIQKYSNDTANGERLLFHRNGNLKTKTTYVNGAKQGIEYHFFENGVLECELVWRNNSFGQEMREYDNSGRQVFIHSSGVKNNGFSIVIENKNNLDELDAILESN